MRSELGELAKGSPFLGNSQYRHNFIGFGGGSTYHEKRPWYPIYSLPFNGDSSYRKNFLPMAQKEEEMDYERNLKMELRTR